jgi:hypothetical protein
MEKPLKEAFNVFEENTLIWVSFSMYALVSKESPWSPLWVVYVAL